MNGLLTNIVSGETVKDPVISPRSGKIFERNLIVNYLSTNSTDPINDEPLTIEELISINTDNDIVEPKQPNTHSIPSLLASFQNEFDSMALENFTLRKQLNKAREELSSALYQYDAAVKVAANAIKERDDVKRNLQELTASIGGVVTSNGHEEKGIDNDIELFKEVIKTSHGRLFEAHKLTKFQLPIIQEFSVDTEDLHSIKDCKIVYYDETVEKLLVNVGKQLIVKDLITNDEYTVNHKGSVTCVNLIQYKDMLVPIYSSKNTIKVEDVLIRMKQNVVTIKSHPGNKSIYVVLCNKSFTFIQNTEKIITVDLESKPTTCEFHIDGALVFIATQGQISVYDILEGEFKANISTRYPKVDKIVSGLNGYWVIVSSSNHTDSSIEVIDLRKLTILHTIEIEALKDFIVDRSCSLILSSTTNISVHKYTKKAKSFQDFVFQTDINNVEHLFVRQSGEYSVKCLGLTSNQVKTIDLQFK